MFSRIVALLVAFGLSVFASAANAAVVLTDVDFDVATPEALAALILIGLAVMWGIRKLIKLTNRS